MPKQKVGTAFMNIYRINKPLPNYRIFTAFVKNNSINKTINQPQNKINTIEINFFSLPYRREGALYNL